MNQKAIGITGVQGFKIQGTTGLLGTTGVLGATGIQGITSIKGATGIQGITGIGGVSFCCLCKKPEVFQIMNKKFVMARLRNEEIFPLCFECFSETKRMLEEMKSGPIEDLPLYMGIGQKNPFVMNYIAQKMKEIEENKGPLDDLLNKNRIL